MTERFSGVRGSAPGLKEPMMSWVMWITGPPGSGKTTLARAVAAALDDRGVAATVVSVDEVAREATPRWTATAVDPDTTYWALVDTARRLAHSGVPVIVDAAGARRAWRELARATIPTFAEVELRCPPAVCQQRRERRRPGPTIPAPDARVPYEPSAAPDLALDTEGCDRWTQVQAVVYLAQRLARQAAGHVPEAPASNVACG